MALQQVPREVVESPCAAVFKTWLERGMVNQMHVGDSPASGRRLNYMATKIPSKLSFL